jgi:hypothetical protein
VQAESAEGLPAGSTVLLGKVAELTDSGPLVQLRVICRAGFEMKVSLGKREYQRHRLALGDTVHLAVTPNDLHVLED